MTKVELYKSRIFVFLIHISALGQFAYALFFADFNIQQQNVKNNNRLQHVKLMQQIPDIWPKKLNLLTYWCLILQTLYYIIALTNDIAGTNEATSKRLPLVRRLKDFMMAALAFPIAMIVGISFWGIYAIDRELVFPKMLDAVFPNWLNHVMHTNIVVFIILELFTSFRVYPKRSTGLLSLTTFMLSYLIWLHIVKFKSNLWVYPILDVLDLPYRIAFFMLVLFLTIALYFLGEGINNVVWNKELKIAQNKVK